ncbi:S46 family peptidase [Caulobacter segnis]
MAGGQAAKPRDPDTAFDFVSSNDIVGGNSGSPVLDAAGRLVGVAFDGNLPSLGGAYGYDGTRNRTISVSAAAIVEALAKVYERGAPGGGADRPLSRAAGFISSPQHAGETWNIFWLPPWCAGLARRLQQREGDMRASCATSAPLQKRLPGCDCSEAAAPSRRHGADGDLRQLSQ